VEESWPLGNISTELAYMIQRKAFDYLDAPIIRVTGRDVPLPYAPTLIQEYLPNKARVIEAVKQVTYKK
jgi:pyruvate dehydrogenase E1 component beta subunit